MEVLRIDVVNRRCRVEEEDIRTLTTVLNITSQSLKDMRGGGRVGGGG